MVRTDFPNGELFLPTTPAAVPEAAEVWLSDPLNAALLLLSVVIGVVNLGNFARIGGTILACMTRPKMAIEMEHNLQLSRTRGITFLVLFLPFLLVCSRYRLLDPEIFNGAEGGLYLLELCGTFAAYFLLKYLISILIQPSRLDTDSRAALRRSHYNFLCIISILFLLTTGILAVFGNVSARLPFYIEAGVIYVVQLSCVAQILRYSCSSLSTILYLCALELLPTSALIVSMLIF